jgi:hypothetical protein
MAPPFTFLPDGQPPHRDDFYQKIGALGTSTSLRCHVDVCNNLLQTLLEAKLLCI